jgi:hypothetical protein
LIAMIVVCPNFEKATLNKSNKTKNA